MLFNEIYSCYFNAVAEILAEAAAGNLTRKKMTEIIHRKAFGESMMVIPDALNSGEWPLLTENMETPVKHTPTQPLTTIQLRWMKALLLDRRIRLFQPEESGLEKMEPLYKPEMFVYYDQYQDGDPYEEETYIRNFRTILAAIQQKKRIRVTYSGKAGKAKPVTGFPVKIEYSSKDDKFRLKLQVFHYDKKQEMMVLNLGRIVSCSICETEAESGKAAEMEVMDERTLPKMKNGSETKRKVTLELTDQRNALERAMLHFSYLEKETKQLNEKYYHITLYYDVEDETELLIQIMSFGPMVRVLEPEDFRQKIKRRLEKQMKYIAEMEKVQERLMEDGNSKVS